MKNLFNADVISLGHGGRSEVTVWLGVSEHHWHPQTVDAMTWGCAQTSVMFVPGSPDVPSAANGSGD